MNQEIATLHVKLQAATARFDRAIDTSTRKIERNTERMRSAVNRVDDRISGLSSGLSRLGPQIAATFAVGSVVSFGRRALETADRIDKLSLSTQISTDRLQTLSFAADQLGVGADTLTAGLERFSRRLGEFANSGGGPAAKALETLGLETEILSDKFPTMNDRLDEVLRRLAAVPDPARQAALAAQLFGDEVGPKFARLLAQGIDGMEELEQKARDLGIVMEEDTIQKSVEAKDTLDALFTVIETRGIIAFAEFAPVIGGVADALLDVIEYAGRAQTAIRDLSRTPDTGVLAGAKRGLGRGLRQVFDPFGLFTEDIGDISAALSEEDPLPGALTSLPSVPAQPTGLGGGSRPRRRRRGGGRGRRAREPREDDSARRFLETLQQTVNERQREAQIIGLSERASVRLQAQFEKERAQRELTAAAAREGATITQEEIALAQQLIDEQFELTIAAYDREQALEAQAEAAKKAKEQEEELARALADTADRLLQAAQSGKPFLSILLEIARIGLEGLGGQGPLGSVLGSLFNSGSGGSAAPLVSPFPTARPPLPAFARGGITSGPSLAGEAGVEAVVPLPGNRRIPVDIRMPEVMRAAPQRGMSSPLATASPAITVNINGVSDFDSFRRNERQLSAGIARAQRQAGQSYD
ncbi:MAG: hypothetical protein AAFR84_00970 [Pseudomonadota bacterium]